MKIQNDFPLVSVVIPNFNGGRYIQEAVESVLSQSYKNVEVVVVDDGSTDHSRLILEGFGNLITLIAQVNQGPSRARNRGILSAHGEYIAFLDADDLWRIDKLELQMKLLQETKSDLVYCDYLEFGEFQDQYERKSVESYKLNNWFLKHPTSTPFIPSSALVTRTLLANSGLWNTVLKSPAEDFDFFRRCISNGKASHLGATLVFHRQHPDSTTASGHTRYFRDNVKALRVLFAEEREDLTFITRIASWYKLHFQHLKHAMRSRDFSMVVAVCRSVVKLF